MRRCLARDPARRFARVEDVLAAEAPARSRRWFLAAGGAAGVAAATTGVWVLAGRRGLPLGAPRGAAADLVALLPVAGPGDVLDAPLRLAMTIDLHAALATAGAPLLALDGGTMPPWLGGTAVLLAREPDPVAAALAIPGVDATVACTLASPSDDGRVALDVTVTRARAAGWRRRFARPAAEVLVLVEDVAAAIASELAPRPTRAAPDAIPIDPAAYRRYGEALAAAYRTRPSAALPDEARWAPLARAAAAQPGLTRALARLAEGQLSVAEQLVDAAAVAGLDRARATADRALAADPDHPRALSARARAALLQWRWGDAERDARRALAIAPTDERIELHRSFHLMMLGRFDDAIALAERLRARNPRAVEWTAAIGWYYYYGRRYQRAVDHIAAHLGPAPALADYADQWLAIFLALSLAELARYDDALATADRLRGATHDPYLIAAIVPAYVAAGRTDEARALLAELDGRGGPYMTALAHAALGDAEAALPLLEQVVDAHNVDAVFLKIDRFPPATRAHPRFQALLRRIGFP